MTDNEVFWFCRGLSIGAVLGAACVIMLIYASTPPRGGGGARGRIQ